MQLLSLCFVIFLLLSACSREVPAGGQSQVVPSEVAAPKSLGMTWVRPHTQSQFAHLYQWMRTHKIEPEVGMIPKPNADGGHEVSILNHLTPKEAKALFEFLDSDPIYADWKPLPEAWEVPYGLHIADGKVELRLKED